MKQHAGDGPRVWALVSTVWQGVKRGCIIRERERERDHLLKYQSSLTLMLQVSQLHDRVSKKIRLDDDLENENIYIFTLRALSSYPEGLAMSATLEKASVPG